MGPSGHANPLRQRSGGAVLQDATRAESCVHSSPLLVPLVLALASAAVFIFPEKGAAVFLLLGALATYGPTMEPTINCLGSVMEKVMLRAMDSQGLRLALRSEMVAVLGDPVLMEKFTASSQEALQATMLSESSQSAMVHCCVKAIEDGQVKATMKDAILESLHDSELRAATVANLSEAAIMASQDASLQTALNTAARSAIKEILEDDTLTRTFFSVMQEGLKDPHLHSAVMKGALSTINPLKENPINRLKGVSAFKVKESEESKKNRIDEEAKTLADASGLARAPPPMVPKATETSASQPQGAAARNAFGDAVEVERSS